MCKKFVVFSLFIFAPSYAAIRNTEDRQHLISFALTAFVSKEPVVVVLNGGDKYFADRCTISRISSIY